MGMLVQSWNLMDTLKNRGRQGTFLTLRADAQAALWALAQTASPRSQDHSRARAGSDVASLYAEEIFGTMNPSLCSPLSGWCRLRNDLRQATYTVTLIM